MWMRDGLLRPRGERSNIRAGRWGRYPRFDAALPDVTTDWAKCCCPLFFGTSVRTRRQWPFNNNETRIAAVKQLLRDILIAVSEYMNGWILRIIFTGLHYITTFVFRLFWWQKLVYLNIKPNPTRPLHIIVPALVLLPELTYSSTLNHSN